MRNVAFLWSTIVALLVACGALGYLWIDRTISLSYLIESARATEQARDQAIALLANEWRGQGQDAVLKRLTEAKKISKEDVLLKRETDENIIWFGQLRFEFTGNRLSEIR